MSANDVVSDDEVILKRIPPGKDNIKPKDSSTVRATSFGIQPRRGEKYPSWSRQRLTSAAQLLQLEAVKRDVSGWSVAAVRAASVRNLGLEVVSESNEEDPGHCLIVPTHGQKFTPKIWSKLAKKTKIVWPAANDRERVDQQSPFQR